ncbi:pantoate--beta-alanine ligase PAN6 [Aspergillus affinis]|uniref:pantoate--beta-alanine ligase PAN6 n=1 Tax=Aspergillus affinis TaxID=1070780 RepID=UPI0022FEED63|nr:pantoate--beta-alanine ligase [Aspergillus affinis]KAI9045297.1 pantoate--beta-alanine ligase [Aspergillus affinis]
MKLHVAAIPLILASSALALESQQACYRRLGDDMRHENTFTYQTSALCMRECGKRGLNYAALRGVECLCGSEKPLEKYEIPLDNCDTPCSGWPKDICGGYKAWSLYVLDDGLGLSSSTTAPSSTDITGSSTSGAQSTAESETETVTTSSAGLSNSASGSLSPAGSTKITYSPSSSGAASTTSTTPSSSLPSLLSTTASRLTTKPPTMASTIASSSSTSPSIQVFRDPSPLRQWRRQLLLSNKSLGFVPTMGALHEGHLSLMRQAAAENTDILVSIYVNPTQFGVSEDLSSYPRTWDSDVAKLQALNAELAQQHGETEGGRVTAILAPTSHVMYPSLPPSSEIDGDGSFVTITPISRRLEGASRPVFFRGVATVCMKLFNIAGADRAYFGQKDVQQTVVIKRMVKDFHVDTEIRIGETVREEDGLAMSSRNVYLGERRRGVGLVLYRALRAAEEAYASGKLGRGEILEAANDVTGKALAEQQALAPEERALYEVDYISLADPESLDELEVVDPAKGAILSGAVKMAPLEASKEGEDCGLGDGKVPVRLIDNLIMKPRSA